jgi:hypothetical protein
VSGAKDHHSVGVTEPSNNATHSVGALRRYLSDVLEHTAEVELFACWEGDQNLPPLGLRCAIDLRTSAERDLFVPRWTRTSCRGRRAGTSGCRDS